MEAELKTHADVVAHDLSSPLAGIALLVTLLEQNPQHAPAGDVLVELRASTCRASTSSTACSTMRVRRAGRARRARTWWRRSPPTCGTRSRTPTRRWWWASCRRCRGMVRDAEPRRQRAQVPARLPGSRSRSGGKPPVATVRDNGIGIDRDDASRIFGVLARGEARGGQRDRVALCRRVVEAHGGHIWGEPAVERLPLHAAPGAHRPLESARAALAVRGRRRIALAHAVPVIEDCFRRMAVVEPTPTPPVRRRRRLLRRDGSRRPRPRRRRAQELPPRGGPDPVRRSACSTWPTGSTAMIAADRLCEVRTGAASGRGQAPRPARAAELWVHRRRVAGRVAAHRDQGRGALDSSGWSSRAARRSELGAFAVRAEAAEAPTEAGGCDVVATATSSNDPVLRGDWLSDGALVCAIGANDPRARELDARRSPAARSSAATRSRTRDSKSGDLTSRSPRGSSIDWLRCTS